MQPSSKQKTPLSNGSMRSLPHLFAYLSTKVSFYSVFQPPPMLSDIPAEGEDEPAARCWSEKKKMHRCIAAGRRRRCTAASLLVREEDAPLHRCWSERTKMNGGIAAAAGELKAARWC
jgi:hypothetical protein